MAPPTSQPTLQEGWHVVIRSAEGDKTVGPVDDDKIIEMVRGGALNHQSLVWRQGMKDWVPIAQIPELSAQMTAPPTQPGALNDRRWAEKEQRIGDNMGIRMLIPVGRSIWAIVSGYLGLFSVLLFPAPFALLTGIIAIWDIRSHEHRHGMGRAIFGVIAGALGSLGLVAALASGTFGP